MDLIAAVELQKGDRFRVKPGDEPLTAARVPVIVGPYTKVTVVEGNGEVTFRGDPGTHLVYLLPVERDEAEEAYQAELARRRARVAA